MEKKIFQYNELTAKNNFDENVLISSDFLENQQYCLDVIWKGFKPSLNSTVNEGHIIINSPQESPIDDSHCTQYYKTINRTIN